MEQEILWDSGAEPGAMTDGVYTEATAQDSGVLTVVPIQVVGHRDYTTIPTREGTRLNVVIGCSAVDASHPALKAFNRIAVSVPNNMVNEAQPVERVSPTMWKYHRVIDLYLDMIELTIVIQSEDYGNIGYLTVQKQEIIKHMEGTTLIPSSGQAVKYEFVMEADIPEMWMSFAVSIAQEGAFSSSSILSPVVNSWLGNLFWGQFQQTGDLADISNAIKYQKQAVELTSDSHADMHLWLGNLGRSFSDRFEHTDDLADISNAIKYERKAIQLTPEGHVKMPSRLSNLGTSYSLRFDHTGDLAHISTAIKYQQQAIQLTPEGDADMPAWLNNLGTSYSLRFDQTGGIADISNAIKYQQKAVQLTPDGQADMPVWLSNLGRSFSLRFEQTGVLADLSNAIRYEEEAVQLTLKGDIHMPLRLNNLGITLFCRFEQTGHLIDISTAIKYQQQAIQLTPKDHADMPSWLGNLGLLFSSQFEQTGDLSDISSAIKYEEEALRLTPVGHAHMPSRLNNLGTSFSSCFEQTGDLADISNAIKYQQQAVQLTPVGNADLPSWLGGLGRSFSFRFKQTGDLGDISNAIKYEEEAVQLTPAGHAQMPSWLNNLGTSFSYRFEQTSDLADISNAIKYQQQAIQLTSDGHAKMPSWVGNLGTSFSSRFEQTDDLADISNAIKYAKQAVQLTPKSHADMPLWLDNLGTFISLHFEKTGDLDDIPNAIKYQQQAVKLTPQGHAVMALRLGNLACSFLSQFEQTAKIEDCHAASINYRLAAIQISGAPTSRLKYAQQWARCSLKLEDINITLEALRVTVELLSLVAGFDKTIQKRHTSLVNTSEWTIIAANFAFCTKNTDTALEWLEQGRCIVWSQLNQLRTPLDTLKEHHEHLADRFSAVSRALEASGSRQEMSGWTTERTLAQEIAVEDQVHAHVTLAKEWTELLTNIRELPNFHNFLCPPNTKDILTQLPLNGFVVVINVHLDQCHALVMHGTDKPLHIPLKKFTYEKAEELCNQLRGHLTSNGLRMREIRSTMRFNPTYNNVLSQILYELWTSIVWPVLENIGYTSPPPHKTHIWWCTTGPLAFLPIHAAGIYNQKAQSLCISDFAVSSYIPTVSILLEKLQKSTSTKPEKSKILLLSQPHTPDLPAIPGTTKETQAVHQIMRDNKVEATLLKDEEATVVEVMKEMNSHGWAHFACHAAQNIANPLTSGFYLHDGQLQLSEIIRQQLPRAEFAFLSACQTSVGEERLPEESVHLAAGMLAAGYQGAIATMWSIEDASAPDIAEGFYKYFLKEGRENDNQCLDSANAAYALDHAIQQIRCKLDDKEEDFLTWVPYVHFGL